MFPRTKLGEKKHRKHKRELEVSLAIEVISNFIQNDPNFESRNIRILEFGSGDGFQIPYLQQIGNVTASDIYTSDDIKNLKGTDFIECSITDIPFKERQFDIVFSNHVLEHIKDIHGAFEELKRIGKPDCIYGFSVPTNIWLLLSIPAHYYKTVRNISRKLLPISPNSEMDKPAQDDHTDNSHRKAKSIMNKLFRIICPPGHGVYPGFVDCCRSFRIEKWQQLFHDSGFSIVRTQPLLLYAPSEWPIIPTTRLLNRFNICSSVLFLMRKLALKEVATASRQSPCDGILAHKGGK